MSFKFEVINAKEVKIVKYIGKEENLVIPSFTFIDDKIYKVTRIEKYSLNNEYIKRIFIPKTIKRIHLYAFMGFKEFNIEEFIVDESNTSYSSIDGNLYNKDKTVLLRYASKSKKEIFDVPLNVQVIEDSSFDNAIYLKRVNLPNTLVSINEYAFALCSSLKKIDLPSSLKEIKDYAFFNNENLEDIKIPKNLSYLGEGVFYSIRNPLINISVSRENKYFKIYKGGLYSFDKKVLYKYLSGGETITLSSHLENISPYAFCYLYINEVILPKNLKKIGFSSFIGSTISKINIPNNVKIIEKSTFSYCKFLININLKNVDEIDSLAFYGCKNLANVELSSCIKLIGDNAFSQTKINKLNNSSKVGEEKKEVNI